MKLIRLTDRKYKVGRDARGSNQYQRRVRVQRHPKARGVLAFISLMAILLTSLYLNLTQPAQAAQPKDEVQKVVVREEVDMTQYEDFMKLQLEWNKTAQEWMRQQEIINQGI